MSLQRVSGVRFSPSTRIRSVASFPAGGASRGLARQLFGGSGEHTLALLRAAWLAAVGPELARRTEVVALEAGTLRVRVPDAGWRKTLHSMRGNLLSKLSAVAGDLAPRRLGFLETPVTTRSSAGPAALPVLTEEREPKPSPLPLAVQEAAGAIADPDLRERFLESALRYLARSRTP